MKLPTEMTFYHDDDTPFVVRFDYDKGEDQWFDAKAGVGSPGYDPSVSITEVRFADKWESPEVYPQMDWERMEQEVLEKLIELEADEQAARDEAEYDAFNELMALARREK